MDAHDDEIWAVLEGEITFFVGEQRYDLGPGDVAFGPRGVPRRHVVRSPESRLLVTSVPTGVAEWFTRNGTSVAFAGELPRPSALTPLPAWWAPTTFMSSGRRPRASDAGAPGGARRSGRRGGVEGQP
ncbi:cupin domain-containing protein [Streptomyces mirabilis]|uniref:cupin domain-containing protein n=1 Tax=Streptomyces mirabilis TaxID=68239 RepID=UPI0031BAAC28